VQIYCLRAALGRVLGFIPAHCDVCVAYRVCLSAGICRQRSIYFGGDNSRYDDGGLQLRAAAGADIDASDGMNANEMLMKSA